MWLRFQIGSKRPLAKRIARMFCAASLPRKWSMRKICSSSNTLWTMAFSSRALAMSVPNGFSSTTLEPSARPGVPNQADHLAGRGGGDAEVVKPARLTPEPRLGARDRRGQPGGAGRVLDVGEPSRRTPRARRGRPRRERTPCTPRVRARGTRVVERFERGADELELGHQAGAREVQDAGQQLAACEVTGGAEEDDRVRSRRAHVKAARLPAARSPRPAPGRR